MVIYNNNSQKISDVEREYEEWNREKEYEYMMDKYVKYKVGMTEGCCVTERALTCP